jgi:hypothetical protein
MPHVVRLLPPPQEPQPHSDVVELLERLLIDAKAGKLRGLSASLLYSDRTSGYAYAIAPEVNVVLMLGEQAMLGDELTALAKRRS